jgi:uncharacterized protein YbjT (DUF2867 family)
MKKTILVTGATGAQGGSVARHLLKQDEFRVRCLTRDSNSPAAIALLNAGAEIVEGNLSDKQSLIAAMLGCYGVFGTTNFWEHFTKEREHGINLVDAVAESSVPYLILSTLPHYKKLSNGRYSVPHCDIKAELEQYARTIKPDATFVHVAFYYENFFSYFVPQKRDDGSFAISFPQGETNLAAVSVEDVGGIVATLFQHKERYEGQTISIVGDDRRPADYAEAMSVATDRQVVYQYCPRDIYADLGFPGAEELANMFEVQRLYIPERRKDMEQSRTIYKQLKTFSTWAAEKKDALRAIMT